MGCLIWTSALKTNGHRLFFPTVFQNNRSGRYYLLESRVLCASVGNGLETLGLLHLKSCLCFLTGHSRKEFWSGWNKPYLPVAKTLGSSFEPELCSSYQLWPPPHWSRASRSTRALGTIESSEIKCWLPRRPCHPTLPWLPTVPSAVKHAENKLLTPENLSEVPPWESCLLLKSRLLVLLFPSFLLEGLNGNN